MVDLPRLLALLERISTETAALRRSAALSDAELDSGSDALAAVKYRFVVAIEAAVDVCRHVAASEGLRPPRDMRDAFVVLVEAGWLPGSLDLAGMAVFRNLLVQGCAEIDYAEIDDERVRKVLRDRLDDLDAFRRVLAQRALGP